MLVLSRKTGESITIGKGITVKVLSIHEGQIKIGIEAPKEITVHRTEIYHLVQQQNRQAALVVKSSVLKAAAMLNKRKNSSEKSV
jgi:carbon storage regulator